MLFVHTGHIAHLLSDYFERTHISNHPLIRSSSHLNAINYIEVEKKRNSLKDHRDRGDKMAKTNIINLLALLCFLQTVSSPTHGSLTKSTSSFVDNWLKSFTEIFGETKIELTPAKVFARMVFLRDRIETVRGDQWVKPVMINIVNYWYDAMTDNNAAHCNLQYLDRLNDDLLKIRSPPTRNMGDLFTLIYEKLMVFCSQQLSDSADKMNHALNSHTRASLIKINLAHEAWTGGKLTRKKLAKRVFDQLKAGHSPSKAKLIESWMNGPCAQLRQIVQRPDKQALADYSRMFFYRGKTGYKRANKTTDLYARMIHSCEQLDPLIQNLAGEYSTGMMGKLTKILSGKGSAQPVADPYPPHY